MNPFDREDSQHENASYTAKAPSGRTAKGKAAGKAIPVAAELAPQQAEERQRQMRALIQLGKEQGYLTHAQINDHLPDNFAQTAAIESIVSAFNDMGVQVYEQAPDAETLLLNSNAPAVVSDDQADEETEVALSTVDSEFGRTTDPVRMYMREMGATELLTRAGEIAIAKRIEDGLHEMVQAIAACPLAISAILASAQQVADGELRIDELVDGLNEETVAAEDEAASTDAAADVDADTDDDEDEDSDDDVGPADSSAADEARLKQLTSDCLEIFAQVGMLSDEMNASHTRGDVSSKAYLRAREEIQQQLAKIRFTARTIDRLCGDVQHQVAQVRAIERQHSANRRSEERHAAREVHRVVSAATKPTSAGRNARHAATRRTVAALERHLPAIQSEQQKLIEIEATRFAAAEASEGNQPSDGRGRVEDAQGEERDDRGESASRDLDREEVREPRHAVPRPDPGRQHRPDEGGGQVRIPSRLEVFDVCNVVGSSGRDAFARRSGSHDPRAGAHDRNDQQAEPHFARNPAADGQEAHPSVLAERMELSEEKVRGILKIAKQPVSMETPVGDDGDATLGDMIEDSAASSPADAAMQADLRAAIDDALDSLSPREAKVLRMRYGINTKSDHTLEEVGKQFDVTRERIRQIESKAMRKLMHPSRADRLKSFLDR